jgi:transcription elongation factor Elf1
MTNILCPACNGQTFHLGSMSAAVDYYRCRQCGLDVRHEHDPEPEIVCPTCGSDDLRLPEGTVRVPTTDVTLVCYECDTTIDVDAELLGYDPEAAYEAQR